MVSVFQLTYEEGAIFAAAGVALCFWSIFVFTPGNYSHKLATDCADNHVMSSRWVYWYCIDIAVLYFAMMWPLWSRWRDSGHYWWCSFNKHSCSRSPNDEEQRGMVLLVQLCPQYRNSFITGQCPPCTPPSSTIWSFYLLFWTRCFERFCEKIIITFPIFRIPGKCNKLKTPSHRI